MTPQQIEEKRALMGLLGHTYAQMKEIDTHIAAAGSSAKFAGRSEELRKQFETIATTPIIVPNDNLEIMHPGPPPVAPAPVLTPAPVMYEPVAVSAPAPPQPTTAQLEFNFTAAEKNILSDIYNVLYDIKKLLIEAKQQTKPDKRKKIVDCVLCGSVAKPIQVENLHAVQCTGCKTQSITASDIKTCIKEWNQANK